MTKLRKLSVLLLVVLVMAGCGNRTDNAEPTKAPTEEDLMIERMRELTAMDVVSQMKMQPGQ